MLEFKKLPFTKEKTFITSDTHAYHQNIARGVSKWPPGRGQRDFDTEDIMTQHLVKIINEKVAHDDLLIHHGDWSFGGKDKIKKFRDQIYCRNIILIQGNHDHHIPKVLQEYPEMFMEFTPLGYYRVEGIKFVSCHFPMAIWHQSHHDIPHFFGHVHGSYKNRGKSIDVGIDNYYKIHGKYGIFSLEEAYDLAMANPTFLESHHQADTN